MLVNQMAIREIYSSFNVIFNQSFLDTEVFYPKVAMEVPSGTSDENYTWLGTLPEMREWIGGREIVNLLAHTYNIKNKHFERTVSVSVTDIEDDKIGVYKPMIQSLAEIAKKHPDRLVFSLFPKAFTENGYDKVPFISENHPSGTKKGKQSNKMTAKLTLKSYGDARSKMMSFFGENGEPLYITPDTLVVSPQNEAMARRILQGDEINNETNIFKGTAEVLVVPELIYNPEMWFLLCTKKAIKPFIFQNRKKPQFVTKDSLTDDNVFYNNEVIYGVDMRCNAGYGLWQLACGSDGTTEE